MIRVLNVSTAGHTFFCLWEDLIRVGRGLLRVWHYNHQYQTPHRPLTRRHFSRPHTLLGAKKHLCKAIVMRASSQASWLCTLTL